MSKEILKVENLNVSREKETVLKNLNFSVTRGEILVILGPNGAGKTTLLQTLLGFIPYMGKISWKTQNISYLPPQEFLQRKHLPPLSIEEFFLFKKVSRKNILNIFKMVGLDCSLLSRQFGELSTGQFQRMLIAWSLIKEPEVLLFDEPTAGIDVGGEETIYSLLHRFWEEKKLTILLVTHDLSIVWEHANNVLCLNKTSLCFGKPEKVLTAEGLKKLYGTEIKFYRHNHGNN